MVLGTFTDERTDVMGAEFNVNGDLFETLAGKAALSPLVTVDVVLVDAVEDAPPHGQIAPADETDLTKWRIALPVSDRFEFSDKSVERVNRNLLHCLRHVAQMINITEFFPSNKVQAGIAGLAGPVLEHDAYLCERTIKEQPDAFCLLPGVVPTAPEPTVTDKDSE